MGATARVMQFVGKVSMLGPSVVHVLFIPVLALSCDHYHTCVWTSTCTCTSTQMYVPCTHACTHIPLTAVQVGAKRKARKGTQEVGIATSAYSTDPEIRCLRICIAVAT